MGRIVIEMAKDGPNHERWAINSVNHGAPPLGANINYSEVNKMSRESPQNDRKESLEEADPAIDFCNLSVRLNRPSDHYPEYNPYAPPPRNRQLTPHQIASRLIRDPVTTTLHGFSRVANFVWSPHEDYENVLELITSRSEQEDEFHAAEEAAPSYRSPPPALPIIQASSPQVRLTPLTTEAFDAEFATASSFEILTRAFKGVS